MSQRDRIISDFAELLRPLTPDGGTLTPQEIVSRWKAGNLIFSVDKYGDTHCTCGHPIKHVFNVCLIDNPHVKAYPVGSCCVVEVFGDRRRIQSLINLEVSLRKIYGVFSERYKVDGHIRLNAEIVKSKNGFTSDAMRWIRGKITHYEYAYLNELRSQVRSRPQTDKQREFLQRVAFHIATEIYNTSGKGMDLMGVSGND